MLRQNGSKARHPPPADPVQPVQLSGDRTIDYEVEMILLGWELHRSSTVAQRRSQGTRSCFLGKRQAG